MLNVTTTALLPDAERKVSLQLSCGTGSAGCQGTVSAAAGDTPLGTVPFDVSEELTTSLHFPTPVPQRAQSVTFTVTTTVGVGPTSPVTLPVPPARP